MDVAFRCPKETRQHHPKEDVKGYIMQIQDNAVVGIHYTLKNDAGEILDSSEGRDPLVFLQGKGNIISGLESALAGKAAGDKLDVTIEPEDGYGVRREELMQKLPRTAFQGVDDIQVGMQFQAQTEKGPIPLRVAAINGDEITVDANHVLAGERLHFSVSVESVREASDEDMSHGHVH